MKANYHTHTARCGHAQGTDEEYVQAALEQGFDELGFSDHVPWPYRSGFMHPSVRMPLPLMPEYINNVRALQRKYEGKIAIRLGFECEFFPEYMDWLSDMAAQQKLDYLILGCHYEDTDEGGMYYGNATTPAQLMRYVKSAVRGMETGMFTYLAHPDLFMRSYKPFDENCRAAARDLCSACKAYGMPMEYNVHDRYISFMTHRKSYPDADFFSVVAQEGVPIIVGLDAHEPRELSDPTQWDLAHSELAAYGDLVLERVVLRGF